MEDFARAHPGGALGRRLLTRVSDIMRTGRALPIVAADAMLGEAIVEMSGKGMGMTAVVDADGAIAGVFTDGDLRRCLDRVTDIAATPIATVMTRRPHWRGVARDRNASSGWKRRRRSRSSSSSTPPPPRRRADLHDLSARASCKCRTRSPSTSARAACALLTCDVDGVLTDGRIYVDDDGREARGFVLDGVGLTCWPTPAFAVAWITGSSAPAVAHRAKTLACARVPDARDKARHGARSRQARARAEHARTSATIFPTCR